MPFFGRNRELEHLQGRLMADGLTAVVARPLMGKTTLLRKSLKQLEGSGALIGWAESTGEHADLLLRAISNLYANWLANSNYREQVLALWRTRKFTTVEAIANFMKAVLENVPIAPPFVTQLLERLVAASEGSRQKIVPRLSYESARELLGLVSDISKKRIVLVLDNFERSPALEEEQLGLTTFLRNREWSGAHIVVLSRDTRESVRLLRQLAGESPLAKLIELGPLDLGSEDGSALLAEVRRVLPVARELGDDYLLSLVDGYPGVIHWWLDRPGRSSISTIGDLIQAASDAHTIRYRNLSEQVNLLSLGGKRLAARVAMLPQLNEQAPPELTDLFADSESIEEISNLQALGVLDPGVTLPSFGHSTRHDAAYSIFETDPELRPVLALEVRQAIERFSAAIDFTIDVSGRPLVMLAYLQPLAKRLELGPHHLLATKAAEIFLTISFSPIDPAMLLSAEADAISANFAPLFAYLIVAMLDAVNLDSRRQHHRALMVRLGSLAERFPDSKMRRITAVGYANALNYDLIYNDVRSQMEMLGKLRRMADSYHDEIELQEILLRALAQTLARELGADISSPALLSFAALRGEKEYRRLQRQVEAGGGSQDLELTESLNAEVRQRASSLEGKASRDFLLMSILRWVRYSPAPDLDSEYRQLEEIAKRNMGSPLVAGVVAEVTYWCLVRDLFVARLDRRDFWLDRLRAQAEGQNFPEKTDSWLFLALIDTAEYMPSITGQVEDARPLFREIDELSAKRPIFRESEARNILGRLVAGIQDGNEEEVEFRLTLQQGMLGDYPKDVSLREYAVIGAGEILRWCAESGEHREIWARVIRDCEALLDDALLYIRQRYSRHVEKRTRRAIKEFLHKKRKRP